ncbi:MAG: hypothetical protein WB460_12880, partial [Candidatus Acidiferrales bacterium]
VQWENRRKGREKPQYHWNGRNFSRHELSTQGTAFAVALLSPNRLYLKRLHQRQGLAIELPSLAAASQ